MRTIPLLAAAFAVLCSSVCGQTLITQTQAFSGVPDFSAPLLFDKYHGPASDILSINVSYSMTIRGGQFIVDNDSSSSATTTASFGARLNASSSEVALVDFSFQPIIQGVMVTNTQTFNLGPDNGDGVGNYDSSGPDGGILIGQTRTFSSGRNVASAAFGGYAGPGQFTVTATADQVGSLSFNSGIETASTPVNAEGYITITYNVVPEPSSAALFGLAAIGLAFRRRRA